MYFDENKNVKYVHLDLLYVLDYYGSFDIENLTFIFSSKFRKKMGFAVRGGGLRMLITDPFFTPSLSPSDA